MKRCEAFAKRNIIFFTSINETVSIRKAMSDLNVNKFISLCEQSSIKKYGKGLSFSVFQKSIEIVQVNDNRELSKHCT